MIDGTRQDVCADAEWRGLRAIAYHPLHDAARPVPRSIDGPVVRPQRRVSERSAMTRIAIVAASEALRAAIAAALRADPTFDVVAVSDSVDDVAPSVDVVLVARSTDESLPVTEPLRRDTVVGSVLSHRERQILALLADGLGNKQIAARLGISTNTVKTHLELLFEKLGVSSRAEAVATGVKRGLLLL